MSSVPDLACSGRSELRLVRFLDECGCLFVFDGRCRPSSSHCFRLRFMRARCTTACISSLLGGDDDRVTANGTVNGESPRL